MSNIALLSAAHIHTRGFLEEVSRRDDCRLVALWDDMPDRGRRYAAEHGGEFCDRSDPDRACFRQDSVRVYCAP